MEQVSYLFIDGGYARRVYRKAMEAVFGAAGELSVQQIISQMELRPFRTYYYDCLNRIRKNAESDADFNARVEKQEAYFSAIRSLRGVHVQLGTLTGARKRRQKEVDVQLAVDMLTHGFNHNMTHAVLLSGDLDFRPVVETLVRSGVFVAVWYENTSGSKKLYGAADFGQALDWHSIHNWGDEKFKLAHPSRQAEAGEASQGTIQAGCELEPVMGVRFSRYTTGTFKSTSCSTRSGTLPSSTKIRPSWSAISP